MQVGLFEEYLTCGYIFFTLARGIADLAGFAGMAERRRRVLGFWALALISSSLFGLGHLGNAGEAPLAYGRRH